MISGPEPPYPEPLPTPGETGGPGRRVAAAAVLIGGGNVTSRLLGLVREQVIAALFGATGPTSAFRTATRVSTAAYDLLLAGAITSALVPVFSDYAAAGRWTDLSRVLSSLVNLILLGVGALTLGLMLAAPALVTALGADPEQFELTVGLTRLALPSILLLGLAGIHTAVLQATQRFALTAFSVAIYNAGIIAAALLLSRFLGIYALSCGLILGAALQVLLQLSAWRKLRYSPVIDLTHPGVRLVLRLYVPVFLGMLASYAIVVVDTNLAWRTGQDSVAAMAFATTVIQFPIGLVGAAASLAILPTLSRLAGERESGALDPLFGGLLVNGTRLVVLLTVPIAIELVLLRDAVIGLLFQRAAFDATATHLTAQAFLAYAPQLPFVVVDQLLIVAFYARKQTLVPVLVGVFGAGVYLVVALSLIGPFGMPGLALANAVQNSVHAVVLYAILARTLPALLAPASGGFLARVILAGAVCAAVTQGAVSLLGEGPFLSPGLGLALVVALIAAASLSFYTLALVALRTPEIDGLLALVRGRLRARTNDA